MSNEIKNEQGNKPVTGTPEKCWWGIAGGSFATAYLAHKFNLGDAVTAPAFFLGLYSIIGAVANMALYQKPAQNDGAFARFAKTTAPSLATLAFIGTAESNFDLHSPTMTTICGLTALSLAAISAGYAFKTALKEDRQARLAKQGNCNG
ncbi:MAG: hypothetical protein J6Y85_03890 [Alphaproteobacteria bacterium]|nr:hypothetical protein [Alphaproteobacteria bacterium]